MSTQPEQITSKENVATKWIPKTHNQRGIGIDCDNVLAQTNLGRANMTNALCGTNIKMENWLGHHAWMNEDFGTKEVYKTRAMQWLENVDCPWLFTLPMPGACKALQRLKDLGHPLYLITSKPAQDCYILRVWLKRMKLYDFFDKVIIVPWKDSPSVRERVALRGYPKEEVPPTKGEQEKEELALPGENKGRVLRKLGASLLIDDQLGPNMLDVVAGGDKALVFGDHKWNQRWWMGEIINMTYKERMERGLPLPPLADKLPEGMDRAKDWAEVVSWVEKWDKEAEDGVSNVVG